MVVYGTESGESFHDDEFITDIGVNADEEDVVITVSSGRLADLKRREAELEELLTMLRKEKAAEINEFPLTIGVVGFGNFGKLPNPTTPSMTVNLSPFDLWRLYNYLTIQFLLVLYFLRSPLSTCDF